MENQKQLEQVTDAVLEAPTTFDITILPQNRLHKWMQEKGWAKKRRSFAMGPIVLGNLLKISKLLLSIDPNAYEGKGLLDTGYQLANHHIDTVTRILAISINNKRNEPSEYMIAFLKNNLSAKEMMTLLGVVLDKMDLKSFIASIISIRGLNVLENYGKRNESSEVSPSNQRS